MYIHLVDDNQYKFDEIGKSCVLCFRGKNAKPTIMNFELQSGNIDIKNHGDEYSKLESKATLYNLLASNKKFRNECFANIKRYCGAETYREVKKIVTCIILKDRFRPNPK